jgi:hypothetical protein
VLDCIPKHFPRVGEFLEPDDKALTGKSFAVWRGLAHKNATDDDDHKAVVKETETANEAVIKETELANDNHEELHSSSSDNCLSKDLKIRPAIRQPKGECDPENDLPCSCPRRTFVDPPEEMPLAAEDSNRKALNEFIRKHYETSAFNTCKRQH